VEELDRVIDAAENGPLSKADRQKLKTTRSWVFVAPYKKGGLPPIAPPLLIPAFARHESPQIPLASSLDRSHGCHDRKPTRQGESNDHNRIGEQRSTGTGDCAAEGPA
jgi:hypothetical protein